MIDRERVIKGLQIERECVSRDCDRNCGQCDLVQDREWLLSVYDDAIALLKEQEIIRCKDCKYGLYTGTEYLCDRHSGHVNRFGEDQYYKEWHNGNWYCADGERR